MHFDWHRASPEPLHPAYGIRYIKPHGTRLSVPGPAYSIDLPEQSNLDLPTMLKSAYLEPVLERIVKEYMHERPGYAFMLRALMMELISLWMRQLIQSSRLQSDAPKVSPAIQAIADHPEKNWSIAELAALCGYHPIYFSKLFRDEAGVAPKTFLIKEKIKKAKLLLLDNYKLEEITEQLQYGSVHYFSHHFKKETGLSPSEFRLQGNDGNHQI